MTAAVFRRLARALPGVEEKSHMNHPDFRVGGRIFATLDYPESGWAAVMLTREDQEFLVARNPQAFQPVKGKWGEQGATNIRLRPARVGPVREALRAAYEAGERKNDLAAPGKDPHHPREFRKCTLS